MRYGIQLSKKVLNTYAFLLIHSASGCQLTRTALNTFRLLHKLHQISILRIFTAHRLKFLFSKQKFCLRRFYICPFHLETVSYISFIVVCTKLSDFNIRTNQTIETRPKLIKLTIRTLRLTLKQVIKRPLS